MLISKQHKNIERKINVPHLYIQYIYFLINGKYNLFKLNK